MNKIKKNLISLGILLLIFFSWIGILDKYSTEYTNDAIVEAGSAYATARGINAIVSILQSSTISIGVGFEGSISVGEMLDPINDLVERFSHVMTIALGSLVLQKILIVITSHHLFSIFMTFFGILSIIIIFYNKKNALLANIIKFFIIFSVIRFALSFVVLTNYFVDYMFLSNQIIINQSIIDKFRVNISSVQQEIDVDKIKSAKIEKRIEENKKEIKNIKEIIIPELKQALNKNNGTLIESEKNLEKIEQSLGVFVIYNPLSSTDKEQKQAQEKIAITNDEKEILEEKIKKHELRIEALMEDIELGEKQLEGKTDLFNSIVNNFKNMRDNLSYSSIKKKVSNAINGFFELLVLFLIKTVLIPLSFFYLLIYIAKSIWEISLIQIVHEK